jgi:putative phosphoribosyl transferase
MMAMQRQRFRDRTEAGQLLAAKLGIYANRSDVLVLGLARGGIPVAFEIARALRAPLDIVIVRKLGVPGHEELAMGAIASGGVCLLKEDILRIAGFSRQTIEQVITREQHELERRERLYRGNRPAPALRDRTVILVDDGLATGASMSAAVAAVRQQQPAAVIIAVPVAASTTCAEFEAAGEQVICLIRAKDFIAVSLWYRHFPQMTDEEVRNLLEQAARQWGAASQQS